MKTLEKHPTLAWPPCSGPPSLLSSEGSRTCSYLFWKEFRTSQQPSKFVSGRHPLDQSKPFYTRRGFQGDAADVPKKVKKQDWTIR